MPATHEQRHQDMVEAMTAPRFTLTEARQLLKQWGVTIGRTGCGEYRVNLARGREATACYTPDIEDAVATGKRMGLGKRWYVKRGSEDGYMFVAGVEDGHAVHFDDFIEAHPFASREEAQTVADKLPAEGTFWGPAFPVEL